MSRILTRDLILPSLYKQRGFLLNPFRFGGGGGGGGGAARYWRIYITANNGDATYTGIGEVEMRLTSGGVDQCTGGTASASSQLGTGPGTPGQAFDGNISDTSNGWVTAGGSAIPSWLRYDFGVGNDKNIAQVALWRQVNQLTRLPKDFLIQSSSDGTTWATRATVTGQTSWANGVANLYSVT